MDLKIILGRYQDLKDYWEKNKSDFEEESTKLNGGQLLEKNVIRTLKGHMEKIEGLSNNLIYDLEEFNVGNAKKMIEYCKNIIYHSGFLLKPYCNIQIEQITNNLQKLELELRTLSS